ncbi:hypothetical protein [Mucilaginibacter paludis]|uniref:Uncharacterized protein n=1 Tax=Mucilaginibacter paludis DSM 18603 TaxID=714943 RepID=H1YG77_9SPHI|nr:hypothetical protein [Mucilaginibacter paludis]EHQ27341.1 hypothetical protein Mucpa_3237 [Mucilaginibacter paludis DSM 18603]
MQTQFLFPNQYRRFGYCLLVIGLLLAIAGNIYSNIITEWTVEQIRLGRNINYETCNNDITLLTIITGLLLIGFSKEKIEDELIAQLRLDSLQWAIYLNYIILIICVVCINGFSFFSVMVYNMFTPLLFFILRFRLKVMMNNRLFRVEGGL